MNNKLDIRPDGDGGYIRFSSKNADGGYTVTPTTEEEYIRYLVQTGMAEPTVRKEKHRSLKEKRKEMSADSIDASNIVLTDATEEEQDLWDKCFLTVVGSVCSTGNRANTARAWATKMILHRREVFGTKTPKVKPDEPLTPFIIHDAPHRTIR